jgi:hypothetical protein
MHSIEKIKQGILHVDQDVRSAAIHYMGCPHEEGPDFPIGEGSPFCPLWAGKQGSNRRE